MCPVTKLILHPENFLSGKDIIFVDSIYRSVFLTALNFPLDQLHGLLHTQCNHECRIILWRKLLGRMTQLFSFNIAAWMAVTSYSKQSRSSIKLIFILYKRTSCSVFCPWLLRTKLFILDQFYIYRTIARIVQRVLRCPTPSFLCG